jgi:hypothetical protein
MTIFAQAYFDEDVDYIFREVRSTERDRAPNCKQ